VRRCPKSCRLAGLCCLLLSSTPALALEQLTLTLERLSGPGWAAEQLQLRSQPSTATQASLHLHLKSLTLPGLAQPLQNLELHCPQLQEDQQQLRCERGSVQIAGLLRQAGTLSLHYDKTTARLQLNLDKLALGGGQLAVTLDWQGQANRWQITALGKGLIPDRLLADLKPIAGLKSAYALPSALDFTLKANGDSRLQQLQSTFSSRDFKLSNPAGTWVGEKLAVELALNLTQPSQTRWQASGQLKLNSGELFFDPLYIPLEKGPVTLAYQLDWDSQAHTLAIKQCDFRHAEGLAWQAQATLQLGKTTDLQALTLTVPRFNVAQLYQSYLRSWLEDLGYPKLQLTGTANAQLNWQKTGKQQLSLALSAVNLQDPAQRFALRDLNADLHWQAKSNTTVPASRLRWHSLQLANGQFQFPAGQIDAQFQNDGGKLLQPFRLPVLDGAIQFKQLEASAIGSQAPVFTLAADFQPISMEALSSAFGWPRLGGSLAGVIPTIRYSDKRLEVQGAIQMRIFDGDIVIYQLSLDDPLGSLPILNATVDVKNLDLKTLTQFFSFGEIVGRISGYVRKLRLHNWQPVSFDAYLGTPADDEGPHSISQKAVKNLSSLGGSDVTSLLSRSVVGLFESFSYKYLGWGCLLRNGVCQMRGVEPASRGYYLVKGGGLPRIDVIGYNQEVAWDILLQRLKNVTHLGPPTIK